MTLIQKLAASAGIAALLATGACASMPSAAVEASPAAPTIQTEGVAPGAPGAATTWSSAAKTGVGASYEAYVDGQYKDGGPTGAVSRVWFSIANGVLTETMYGLIHEAQIKSLRFAVASDAGLSLEGTDTTEHTEYLDVDTQGRPLSPAYRVVTTDKAGQYEIEKRIFTDPDRNALVLRVTIKATGAAVTPYAILEPHMANTGGGDFAEASANGLYAH